jgi:hypothetical protein
MSSCFNKGQRLAAQQVYPSSASALINVFGQIFKSRLAIIALQSARHPSRDFLIQRTMRHLS